MSSIESDFVCKFEDDTPESERKFYVKAFPIVDQVGERRLHCTTCNGHIGTAPIMESKIRMHPVLRVTICRSCHTFYNSGEFEKGEDGSELYCRWCGQGGEVYCCSNCPYVFCKKCIIQNLSRATVQDIERTDNWACFSCSPQILFHLRAQHWALTNFVEKQLREINASELSESELSERMNKDSTTCCNTRKKLEKKAPVVINKSTRPMILQQKKRSSSPIVGPASKKPCNVLPASAILNGQVPKPSNDVVCTPDILSMIGGRDSTSNTAAASAPGPASKKQTSTISLAANPRPVPPLSIRQYIGPNATMQARTTPLVRTPAFAAGGGNSSSMPMVLNQASVMQQIRPNSAPVYHTINGFRIDLNSAAQQDTFRLPNGKLIQVKKQIPMQPQPTTGIRPLMQQRAQIQNVVRYPHVPQVAPPQILNGIRQGAGAHIQVQSNAIRPQGLSLKPPPPVLQKPNHPATPLGMARNNFEFKVFNTLEICHQIICKINILSNNSSYKNVRHLKDLKELYIHLSYLLTYAQGRFKAVQDKCAEELKNLGFEDAKEDAKDMAEGDVEVIDNPTPLIELDSDEEETTVVKESAITTQAEDTEPTPSTSRDEEDAEQNTTDPKLMLRPRICIQRLETIRPEVIEQLKKIKAEKPDKQSTSNAADSTEKQIVPETVAGAANKEVDSTSKNDTDDEAVSLAEARRKTTDSDTHPDKTQDNEVQSSDAEMPSTVEEPSTSQVSTTPPVADSSKETPTESTDGSSSPAQDNQVSSANSTNKTIVIDEDVEMVATDDPLVSPSSTSGNKTANEPEIVLDSDDDDDVEEIVSVKDKVGVADSSSEKGNDSEIQGADTSSHRNVVESSENDSLVCESSLITDKNTEAESSTKNMEIGGVDDDETHEVLDEPESSDMRKETTEESPQQSDEIVDENVPQQSAEPMDINLPESSENNDEPMEVNVPESSDEQNPSELPQPSEETVNELPGSSNKDDEESEMPQPSAEINDDDPQPSSLQSADIEQSDAPQSSGVAEFADHSESSVDDDNAPGSSANVSANDIPPCENIQPVTSADKSESNEAESQFTSEPEIASGSLVDHFDGLPESSTQNGSPKVSESQITLEDVDVDLFQSANVDNSKNDLNIDDLISDSDLNGLNFDQDAWNI